MLVALHPFDTNTRRAMGPVRFVDLDHAGSLTAYQTPIQVLSQLSDWFGFIAWSVLLARMYLACCSFERAWVQLHPLSSNRQASLCWTRCMTAPESWHRFGAGIFVGLTFFVVLASNVALLAIFLATTWTSSKAVRCLFFFNSNVCFDRAFFTACTSTTRDAGGLSCVEYTRDSPTHRYHTHICQPGAACPLLPALCMAPLCFAAHGKARGAWPRTSSRRLCSLSAAECAIVAIVVVAVVVVVFSPTLLDATGNSVLGTTDTLSCVDLAGSILFCDAHLRLPHAQTSLWL